MGTFGFSYIGLIYLLMLFIPNGLWASRQPEGYAQLAKNENRILLGFERVGQVLTTTIALVFSDFNLRAWTPWSWWLIVSLALMLVYLACWVRYFTGGRTLELFYGSFLGIPVPLASLPIAAFILLGIYGRVWWLVAAALILGIGHFGIHLQHRAAIARW
jgi:hypothetical protein